MIYLPNLSQSSMTFRLHFNACTTTAATIISEFTFLNEFLFTSGTSFSMAHEYSLRNLNGPLRRSVASGDLRSPQRRQRCSGGILLDMVKPYVRGKPVGLLQNSMCWYSNPGSKRATRSNRDMRR